MPLFSDHIANMYYSGTPSYSSIPYSYGSSISPLGTSYSASYLNPGGNYSSHSSLGGYSRTPLTSRWVPSTGRTYSPILSTISERGTSSPVRINSPRRIPITKRNYASSNYIARPININTADIDVSRDKYRHNNKAESSTPLPPVQRASPSFDNENGPFMPRVDGKPETGIDSSPGPQRNTISRGRTVVRLYTVKRKEKDSPRKPIEVFPEDVINTIDTVVADGERKETKEQSIEPVRWREKLSKDLIYKEKKDKKSLGEKLVEKFKVKDKDNDNADTSMKQSVPELEGSQSLPATPLPTASAYQKRSPDRRYSMELLAEQANLLDSLIRSENLSTATLDLTKVGNSNEATGSIKRKATDDLHNPLKTTKSDNSLHDRFNLKKDTRENKHYSKRRSLKKSSSGGSICRLDSITEVPKDLPAIEESRLSIKMDNIKQKVKPKLKTKITSSVEVSAPISPLKFKVEDITVEEKPRTPKKGIIYSTTIIDEIPPQQEVTLDKENVTPRRSKIKYNSKKSRTLITDSTPMSPDPEDGNFWDKIGKRETVYLIRRKQNIEESKEKHRRALCWFQEDEESENNNELESGKNIVLENNPIQNEKNNNVINSEYGTVSENIDLNKLEEVNVDYKLNVEIIPATRDITQNKINDNIYNETETDLAKNDSRKEKSSSKKEREILLPPNIITSRNNEENDLRMQEENESKNIETVAEKSVSEQISNNHNTNNVLTLATKIDIDDDKHKQDEHAEVLSKMLTSVNESVLASTQSNKTKMSPVKSNLSTEAKISLNKDSVNTMDPQINDKSTSSECSTNNTKNVYTVTKNETKISPKTSSLSKKDNTKCQSELNIFKTLTTPDENNKSQPIIEAISESNNNSIAHLSTERKLVESDSQSTLENNLAVKMNEQNDIENKKIIKSKNKDTSKIKEIDNNLDQIKSVTSTTQSSINTGKTNTDTQTTLEEPIVVQSEKIDTPKSHSKSNEKDPEPSESITSTAQNSNSTDETNKDSQTTLEIPIDRRSENIPILQTETKTSSILEKTGEIEKAENISNNEKEEKQEDIKQPSSNNIIELPPLSRKPLKDEPALRPLIATPRPLQKKVPQIIHSSSSSETSSEEESSDDDDDEDDSASSEASAEFFECENNPDGRTSTGSNDSGFDSSAPTSPASFVYIKKEQSTAYDLFRRTGRFTPPARSIPRFRKYNIEDFHFLKVLGKGSFGKVLLAELRDTEYYYAVKCLKKDVVLEDDDVECTLIERKVLALGTNHPYLCHLFATFQTDSHLFFVMEYLNGGDLMFHIQQSGRFPEVRARFYGAEIVSGLKFLHKRGIIYRDLKLDNILLDFDGHVRIADFGMCKLQIYLDKTADTFCGTPDYMAPEIIKGLKYNQTVDWWSFGVLLYEMLIGQSPFSGCDEDELFWSICNEMPAYPRFLSSEALTILTRLLDKDARTRLGGTECMHGDIRDQDFFHPIHWERLERRELEAPFKPRVRHPLDTQYFDRAFTGERPRLTAVEPHVLRSMDQEPFKGFSYTNPNATDR